ncbi:MAG: dockerin type I domain-containing protein [Planctomycetota bacterium]
MSLLSVSVHGQLVSAYDGDEPGPRSWVTDVCDLDNALDSPAGPFGGVEALAADNTTGRLFGSSGSGVTTIQALGNGEFSGLGSAGLRDTEGRRFRDLNSLAFGRGRLFGLNFQRNAGFGDPPTGLYEIDPSTGASSLLLDEDALTFAGLPCFSSPSQSCLSGLAFDSDRDRLYLGVRTAANEQAIISIDPDTGDSTLFRLGQIPFDGLAYGDGSLYLTTGSGLISVIDVSTNALTGQFTGPRRFGNGRGGSTFLSSLAVDGCIQSCSADVNSDGNVTDSDFFAWVTAFTADPRTSEQEAACDVNRDDTCSDSDFFAWVTAFTDGC